MRLIRGDDKTYTVTFLDSDGVAIDITGYTVFFTVKANLTDSDDNAIIKKDITSHSDPTNGQTELSFAASDTDGVEEGTYYFDLQLKDTGGLIKSTKRQYFYIDQDITLRTS